MQPLVWVWGKLLLLLILVVVANKNFEDCQISGDLLTGTFKSCQIKHMIDIVIKIYLHSTSTNMICYTAKLKFH